MEVVHGRIKYDWLAWPLIFLITMTLLAGMIGCDSVTVLEIRNWYDLDEIRDNLSGRYLMMNDLDSATAGYAELASRAANQGNGWKPIGTSEDPFTGSFDGQSYEISGMFINRPDEYSVGLFGAIGVGGIVQNVRMLNTDVAGEWLVGGLVGGNWGDVINSYASGTLSGDDCVGGLVGGNSGEVSNSCSAANVTGHWDIGGLVGFSDSNGTVINSYSVGNLTGEWAVGGLVGGNLGGVVAESFSTGGVMGNDYVGGLVGDNQGTVNNAYATGRVIGEWYVGGLVGNTDSLGVVSNSYASGRVTGYSFVGGLVGSNWGIVSNSFWDIDTSGLNQSDGGTGQATRAMQDIATFTNTATEGLDSPWNMANVTAGETNDSFIWNIVTGQTYPFLGWQPVS